MAKNLALKSIQDLLKLRGKFMEDYSLPVLDFKLINRLVRGGELGLADPHLIGDEGN